MSLASALFSDSQSRVLRCLFTEQPERYHLSELRRRTGLGSASLQRELKRLADAGLLYSERVGNQRHFSANTQSAIYPELVAIVRKTLGWVPALQTALSALQPGLLAAWIYGSVAKQTDSTHSDVDLMLVGTALSLNDVLVQVLPIEALLGRKINPSIYSVTEFQKRRAEPDSFVNRILSQPIVKLIGDPDGLASP
jgi:DNA-binding transcriptional ArsR family regulator